MPRYTRQSDLVSDWLRAIRAMIEARVAHEQSAESETPSAGAELAVIAARVAATRAAGLDLPVTRLCYRLGLSPTEEQVLWLLVAHDLDPTSRRLLRSLATETIADVTYDVVRRVVYGDGASMRTWRELAAEAPLCDLGLVERTGGGVDAPEHRQTLRVARRVLALVHGDAATDPGLASILRAPTAPMAVDEVVARADGRELLAAAIAAGGVAVVVGSAGIGRRTLSLALLAAAGHRVLQINCHGFASDPESRARQLRAVARECRLAGAVPLVTSLDALTSGEGDGIEAVGRELVARIEGPIVLTSQRPMPPLRWARRPTVVELTSPAGLDLIRLWRRAMPDVPGEVAEGLASTYPLAPSLITAAAAGCEGDPTLIPRAVRAVVGDRMAGLATRVDVTQSWDDLVLGRDQLEAIVELLARVQRRTRVHDEWGFATKLGRGLGTAALFSGPPGTGKTMVAGLIARDLGLEIYQADLAQITSKWIGETEKHLAALFDAAEAANAVLLFDEADSLFGRRTEVKSSNDRYANLAVNFLLQRLESFTGVCLLTSNHESAIDEAFRRRLSVHVRFPMPDESERAKLWAAMLPATAPTDGEIDVDGLARRFVMAGGHIRNAVVRGAFLAADRGVAISTVHLARGARLEYEAIGRIA
jgi:hypothetical protein